MPETFQDNRIAAGANNVAGLVNIETILVDGEYFVTVNDIGKWRDGSPVLYGDAIDGTQGSVSTTWVSGHITLAQYNYIYTTLLNNARSGWVTIRTRKYLASTYANYSAILTIGSMDELAKTISGGRLPDFVWQFKRLTVIP